MGFDTFKSSSVFSTVILACNRIFAGKPSSLSLNQDEQFTHETKDKDTVHVKPTQRAYSIHEQKSQSLNEDLVDKIEGTKAIKQATLLSPVRPST